MVGVIDWSQNFDNSLGDGTPITNANLAGNNFRQVVIGAGNAAEIDTALPGLGSRALRLVKGSGSVTRTQLYAYLGAGSPDAAFRCAFRMVARPAGSTTETLFRGFTGATGTAISPNNRIDVLMTSTGRVQIIDTVSGTNATSTVSLNAAAWYYMEGYYNGVNTMTVRVYALGLLTAGVTVSLATMGSYVINEWAVGEISANATNLDINMDSIAFGHDDYLPRPDVTAAPPAVVAQADKSSTSGSPISVTASATATNPATITSITAECVSTTTPGVVASSIAFTNTLVNGGTGSASVTSTSTTNLFAGTYVIRFTATDSNGLTDTDDVTVYVDTLTSSAESIVTGGGAVAVGAADTLSTLRDSSDTGYNQFVAPSSTVAEYRVSPIRVGGAVTVTVRARVSTGTGSVLIGLYEGATLRTPGRSAQSITTSFADYTVTLSGGEVASLVDWANLRVRLTMTAP